MKVTICDGRHIKDLTGVDNISYVGGKFCFRVLWGAGYKMEYYEFKSLDGFIEVAVDRNKKDVV